MILCFDGGGSSSRMLLADDGFNLIGEGFAAGVNTTHTPVGEMRDSLNTCLDQTLGGKKINKIDRAYVTFVGPVGELVSLLEPFGCEIEKIPEQDSALWAGALRESGYVALSGTGSNVTYTDKRNRIAKCLGGYGLLLGDEGSGAWIGQHGLKAALNFLAGTGPATSLAEKAKSFFNLNSAWEIIGQIYAAPSYVRYMASFVPKVAEAAKEGDELSLFLFRQAGECLARLLLLMLERTEPSRENLFCVLCGGVWKAQCAMRDAFGEAVREKRPDIRIMRPHFEPVMSGIVRELSTREPDWNDERRVAFLAERFPGQHIGDYLN